MSLHQSLHSLHVCVASLSSLDVYWQDDPCCACCSQAVSPREGASAVSLDTTASRYLLMLPKSVGCSKCVFDFHTRPGASGEAAHLASEFNLNVLSCFLDQVRDKPNKSVSMSTPKCGILLLELVAASSPLPTLLFIDRKNQIDSNHELHYFLHLKMYFDIFHFSITN